jgi:hypothetical protein
MELTSFLIGALYFILGIVGWFLKDALDSAKNTKDSLAAFKTEVAKEYVPRNDMKELTLEVNRRFDRLEEKIDRIVERIYAKQE